MKLFSGFLSLSVLLFSATTEAALLPYAPVTTAASVTNATTAPGATIVPVTVTDFVDIGYFKLTLTYDPAVLTYVNAVPNNAFNGMTVTNNAGTIVMTWTGTNGIILPDMTSLVNLVFTYNSSTTFLTWTADSTHCIYKKYAAGLYTTCIDQPYSDYFIDGGVSNRGAPVTYAPVISNATPGTFSIPVKVSDFNWISGISLTLEYDSTVLTYQNTYTLNPALVGGIINVGTVHGAPGKKKIQIAWSHLPAVTLPDGSTIITLSFSYSNTTAGYSTLNWIDDPASGFSCSYADGNGITLIDSPTGTYYKNGLVYGSTQYSPQTWLPSIIDPSPGSLAVPVNVSGFTNVKSFTLSFNYQSAMMTYGSFVQNPSLPGTMIVTINAPDTNGNRELVMTWTGSSTQSLPAGSSLCTLNFTYISGASTLAWVTDAASCRFNDANGNAYYDLPKSNYYRNGMVAFQPAPLTVAWYGTGTAGQTVTIPVNVWHYTNIGSFILILYYDPGVLTFQSSTLVPPIGGIFNYTNIEPGSIFLTWTGTATTLPDSSKLINLMFTYHGGNTPLEWYTAGGSCQYTNGITLVTLYDLPKANYYVDGNVGPDPVVANFSANNTTPPVNITVILSDLSTGSPDTWNWNLSPSTFMYVDSTNSSSQNPHVQFTAPADYTVTLIASRELSSNAAVKTNYIKIPNIWTGITSNSWNTPSNWNANTIPSNYTDVQIPASAPHWPVVDSLTIGNQCRSITMAGPSLLTVNGNFTISNGSFLTFTGADTLKIGKNWYNSGIFNSGVGTVEFIGPTAGTIEPVTETFYNLIEAKTTAVLNIPWTVVVNGAFILK
jgi:PKD repeat protein